MSGSNYRYKMNKMRNWWEYHVFLGRLQEGWRQWNNLGRSHPDVRFRNYMLFLGKEGKTNYKGSWISQQQWTKDINDRLEKFLGERQHFYLKLWEAQHEELLKK